MTRLLRFVIWVMLVLSHAPLRAADGEYAIKQDLPPTGSMIRRYEIQGSSLPINKRYHDLSAEDRDQLNRLYERIEPGDEPPFPAEGLKPIYEAVGKAQARLLVTGKLILVVTVDSTGEASAVRAIGSPSEEMTKFAASVLMLTKYKPALCGGTSCRMDYPFSFSFNVR